MNVVAIALIAAVAAPAAGANDAATPVKPPLQLKPKAAIETMSVPLHRFAPFVAPLAEPDLDLLPRRDERLDASRSSCAGERSLCYDPTSGRIVYKPARALMPDFPGLRRENISVKRDRIVFRYSF